MSDLHWQTIRWGESGTTWQAIGNNGVVYEIDARPVADTHRSVLTVKDRTHEVMRREYPDIEVCRAVAQAAHNGDTYPLYMPDKTPFPGRFPGL